MKAFCISVMLLMSLVVIGSAATSSPPVRPLVASASAPALFAPLTQDLDPLIDLLH